MYYVIIIDNLVTQVDIRFLLFPFKFLTESIQYDFRSYGEM